MSYYRKRGKYSYGYGKNYHSHRRKNRYKGSQKAGCFIATAAYGTPMTKEIAVLRKWRDKNLMKSTIGRLFVNIYYVISPPIANLMSKSNKIRALTRSLLKPIVK